MKKSNNVMTSNGARGTKKVVSAGRDNSSMGDTSMKSLNRKMKGGVNDASSSIVGASTPKR